MLVFSDDKHELTKPSPLAYDILSDLAGDYVWADPCAQVKLLAGSGPKLLILISHLSLDKSSSGSIFPCGNTKVSKSLPHFDPCVQRREKMY